MCDEGITHLRIYDDISKHHNPYYPLFKIPYTLPSNQRPNMLALQKQGK